MATKIIIGILIAIALPCIAFYVMSFTASRPDNLGVSNGKLAPCPTSPNCVCTQGEEDGEHAMKAITFDGNATEAKERLLAILADMPRTQVITSDDNYVHAECTSLIFRFVDDVEFLIVPDEKVIHFRSASRAGHSDLGVNRARMESIRKQFEEKGSS